jgi:hypothetical protein
MRRLLTVLVASMVFLALPAMASAAPQTTDLEVTYRDFFLESTCGTELGADQIFVHFSLSTSLQDNSQGDELDRRQRTLLTRVVMDQDGVVLGRDRQSFTENLTGQLSDAATWVEVQTGTLYNMTTVGGSLRWAGSLATDSTGLIWYRGPSDPQPLLDSTFAELFCGAATG